MSGPFFVWIVARLQPTPTSYTAIFGSIMSRSAMHY
jgi:hypothetical protein